MKANQPKKEDEHLEIYKDKMKSIEFMQQYLNDPEIFNLDSIKFKNFLIESFGHLHSDFHHLSFLNNKDIDQELIKIAGILQILPATNNKKQLQLFDHLTQTDIHKFWLRFFTLFKDKKNRRFSISHSISLHSENKVDFLKDLNCTLHYVNYDFPAINANKLKDINVEKEIENWKAQIKECDISFSKSFSYDSERKQVEEPNIEKLIMDLKHVVTSYQNFHLIKQESEVDYCDFFIKFTEILKDILKYKNALKVIDALVLNEIYNEFTLKNNDDDESVKLNFTKRCNNIIQILKTKMKLLD